MTSFGYYKDRQAPRWIRFLRNRKLTVLLVIASAFTILITLSNKGIIQRIRLERDKKELVDRVRALEIENERLRREEKNLTSDPGTIEHVAREKHGMIKPGEVVYRVREVRK